MLRLSSTAADDLQAHRADLGGVRRELSTMEASLRRELAQLRDRVVGEVQRGLADVDAHTLRVGISELQTEMARVLDVELAGLWAGRDWARPG